MKLALAALPLALALLSACAPPPRSPTDTGEPQNLTEADSGKRFDVFPNQEVVVRLASNRTTGYRWQLVDPRSAVAAVLGEPEYLAPASARPGAGGTEVWRLRVMVAGQVTLVFEYRRPFEKGGPAARSASFTLLAR